MTDPSTHHLGIELLVTRDRLDRMDLMRRLEIAGRDERDEPERDDGMRKGHNRIGVSA